MEIEQLEPPLPEDRIGELFALWEAAFDTSYEGFGGIMRGQEIEDNRDFVYLVRRDGEIAGTWAARRFSWGPAIWKPCASTTVWVGANWPAPM